MAARKISKRPGKKAAGGRQPTRRPSFDRRKWLAPALLAVGIAIGTGIGFGLASLPPSPLPIPVALDVPAELPAQAAVPQTPPVLPKSTATSGGKTTLSALQADAADPALANPARTNAVSTSPVPVNPPVAATPQPEAPPPSSAQLASLPSAGIADELLPLWRRNAAPYQDPGARPMLAIVLDDVGVAPQHARAALDLPAPLVLSIMTYAPRGGELARDARNRGHEVMVHMPMQPLSSSIDPGPEALLVGLPAEEIRRRVAWGLGKFEGYVGFNNHMGSRFTQDPEGMQVVLEEARSRGLLFLDSKTIAGSVGDRLAAEMGVTHIARDVFLDDTLTEAAIARQLAAAEQIARRRGYAVAIGHPHPATIAVLKRSLPGLAERGIAIVPLTAIVKKRDGVSG